jgi:hypothetical protein
MARILCSLNYLIHSALNEKNWALLASRLNSHTEVSQYLAEEDLAVEGEVFARVWTKPEGWTPGCQRGNPW